MSYMLDGLGEIKNYYVKILCDKKLSYACSKFILSDFMKYFSSGDTWVKIAFTGKVWSTSFYITINKMSSFYTIFLYS